MQILQASAADIPALAALINSGYRGEASKKGWTTEADLLLGELRTDVPTLSGILESPSAVMLKYVSEEGAITGSVFLDKQERGLYLGMLTVSPELQAAGIGRRLLLAAEDYARNNQCRVIFMNVISVRHELIAWYQRRGYHDTGERKPLQADHRFGVPTQPLEFVILEKKI